ncbi:hypothetical protein DQ04_04271000 [Trypanosoma grayi]|uniref:hypothetical protein n=1 Tax=Trypanosoma grayi TaxID=71804 RepID=UPI0004F43734|nr:hypothetical protein DQ04_04271000 [Trypanosoma grayi]KEG10032.1 hypothetical protein DQ04_04271000 [Trypanosoma grayi]
MPFLDNDAPVSEPPSTQRPLRTLGWETLLAEEGTLQTAAASGDDRQRTNQNNNYGSRGGDAWTRGAGAVEVQWDGVGTTHQRPAAATYTAAVAGGVVEDTVPPLVAPESNWLALPHPLTVPPHMSSELQSPRDPRGLAEPRTPGASRLPTAMHWSAPGDSPPAWTRPSFNGTGWRQSHHHHQQQQQQQSIQGGHLLVLQEVFPAIGSRRHPRQGKTEYPSGVAETGGLVPPQPQHQNERVASVQDSLMMTGGSAHKLSPASPDTRAEKPLLGQDEGAFSRKDIVRDADVWDNDTQMSETPTRTADAQQSALMQREDHSARPTSCGAHRREASPRRNSPASPVAASPSPNAEQQQLVSAAQAIQTMQRTADELAHRVLMAERELHEGHAEFAVLRNDLTRSLEVAERVVRRKMSALRDLRAENERLRRLLDF